MDEFAVCAPATIERDLIAMLQSMVSDWDLDPGLCIGPDTRLVNDLDCSSIDIVQLIVMIQEHFDRRDLPFEHLLLHAGQYVDDIRVSDFTGFLATHLSGGKAP